MNEFSGNLKFLRKKQKLTQSQLAERIGLNRSVIGAYEEGRAEPKFPTLITLAQFFNVTIDDLLTVPIQGDVVGRPFDGANVRVLTIPVEKSSDKELVTIVPQKAAAGYLEGFGDMEYIASLPTFQLPVKELEQDRTYRAFQIEGDSMLPIPSGSYIIASYVDDWTSIGGNKSYVVVTKDEGIAFKRIQKQMESTQLTMISNNALFPPYSLDMTEIAEIWQARAHIGFDSQPKV